jgi:hypothetical protein
MPYSDRRWTYKAGFFLFYSSSGGGESISFVFLLTFFWCNAKREIIVDVNKHHRRTRYLYPVSASTHSLYI